MQAPLESAYLIFSPWAGGEYVLVLLFDPHTFYIAGGIVFQECSSGHCVPLLLTPSLSRILILSTAEVELITSDYLACDWAQRKPSRLCFIVVYRDFAGALYLLIADFTSSLAVSLSLSFRLVDVW